MTERKARFIMVYFFYGADSYRIRQKVNKVVEGYQAKHKSGFNFGRFDLAKEESLAGFKNFIDSYSMFAEKKLALVSNLFGAGDSLQEEFLEYLSKSDILKTQESFLVVEQAMEMSEEKRGKEKYVLWGAKELFKKLTAKPVEFEEFDVLTGVKLENWIKKEVQDNGGQMDNAAVKKLALAVGADLWQMGSEINKLISFRGDKMIFEADVDEMVKAKIENDIFKTIDALAARNKAAAFKLLHQHLAQGESEIYLLSMLAYQFRNLLLVKSELERGAQFQNLGKKLSLHPYVLRKSFEQSRGFSLPALKKIYERLLETDLAVKSGQAEPRVALDLVVGEITR